METVFETDNALTVKLYHEKLYRDARKESYFERFMSNGEDTPVQTKTDLESDEGDAVTFGIRYRLKGDGVTDDNVLEGHEEELSTADFKISLTQLRNAVRTKGKLSDRRPLFRVPNEARAALKDWMSEKIDQKCFDALDLSPTKVFYGGDATSTADIDATDKVSLGLISRVKTWASTGGNRTQPKLRGINIGGKKHYILLVHNDVEYDLKRDPEYLQAQREAEVRGKNNPLFSGALAVWDDVIIHSHENIPIVTTWGAGSNVAGARCHFLGAQALCWAWGMRPWVTEETFDYKNKRGFAIGMIYAVAKPKFNNLDYGSIQVRVARTKVSDA